jgi:hypothetical protein
MGVRRGLVILAVLQSGCSLIALGATRKEQLWSNVVETRVTKQPANIDGTQCYVDHYTAVRSKTHIPSTFRIIAGLEILTGLLAMAGFAADSPYFAASGLMAIDGVTLALAIAIGDGHESTRKSWQVTNETTYCK